MSLVVTLQRLSRVPSCARSEWASPRCADTPSDGAADETDGEGDGDGEGDRGAPSRSFVARFNTPLRYVAGWLGDAGVAVGSAKLGPTQLSLASSSTVEVTDGETLLYRVPMYSSPSAAVAASYLISYRTRQEQPTSE
jgi:hypothetical protein